MMSAQFSFSSKKEAHGLLFLSLYQFSIMILRVLQMYRMSDYLVPVVKQNLQTGFYVFIFSFLQLIGDSELQSD